MGPRTFTEKSNRVFTMKQMREEHAQVASAARQKGGCIIVDEERREFCTLSYPETTCDDLPTSGKKITWEHLCANRAQVAATIEESDGYVVVDEEEREIFTLWIPPPSRTT